VCCYYQFKKIFFGLMQTKSKDPLEGKTLEHILRELHEAYGWEGLAQEISINCFEYDPSIKSSLTFLRRTPWARAKVEQLYLFLIKQRQGGCT
jgi:uncharacterized protein (DUF2132 family)